MVRFRAIGQRVLLGWLAAEWFGMLLAYGFMLLTLGFLISYILLEFPIGSVWYVPPVLVMVGFGIYLAFEASQIPREMLRRAVAPLGDAPSPAATEPAPPIKVPVVWESRSLVSRIQRVGDHAFATRTGGIGVGASRRADPEDFSSRWLPGLLAEGGVHRFHPDGRVPPGNRRPRRPTSVEIVDLSDVHRP